MSDRRLAAQDSRTPNRLSPWAAPVTGAPGWQITTRSRRLAVAAAALAGGTVHTPGKGEWLARLPAAILAVVAVGADGGALRCRLSAQPDLGVLVLAFAPWPAATVLKCPVTASAGSGTALGARCASDHADGPHGSLPGSGIHHAVRAPERRRNRPALPT